MALAGKVIYMVALLGQGVRAAAFTMVHHDVYQDNGSLTSARTQVVDQGDCPLGYLHSAYDVWSDTFHTGHASFESCAALCSTTADCHAFEYNTADNNCGVNSRGDAYKSAFANDCTADPGQNGDFPWWVRDGSAVLQSGGNVGYYACFLPVTGCSATPAPTAAPTPASAIGDPHLQNIHGERFDLMTEGKHVLISIPRGESAELTLLRVQADARRLGGRCTDIYFQELNVTGYWAEAKHTGGYHYDVSRSAVKTPQWVALGKVELKVIHGRTDSGLRYLNIYAKHLGRVGFAVGGLLGEDDHEVVSTPAAECMNHMSLQKTREHTYSKFPSAASIAEGAFA